MGQVKTGQADRRVGLPMAAGCRPARRPGETARPRSPAATPLKSAGARTVPLSSPSPRRGSGLLLATRASQSFRTASLLALVAPSGSKKNRPAGALPLRARSRRCDMHATWTDEIMRRSGRDATWAIAAPTRQCVRRCAQGVSCAWEPGALPATPESGPRSRRGRFPRRPGRAISQPPPAVARSSEGAAAPGCDPPGLLRRRTASTHAAGDPATGAGKQGRSCSAGARSCFSLTCGRLQARTARCLPERTALALPAPTVR